MTIYAQFSPEAPVLAFDTDDLDELSDAFQSAMAEGRVLRVARNVAGKPGVELANLGRVDQVLITTQPTNFADPVVRLSLDALRDAPDRSGRGW